MLTDSRSIMTRLLRDGWVLHRVKGSHRIFKHADRALNVVVPHPAKDLPIGTVKDIYRKAGWPPD